MMTKQNIISNPRINSLAYHVGTLDYKEPDTPDTDFIVDDSTFVPISEALKQLGNGSATASKTQLLYDFPDGKDDGRVIPFSRSSKFFDIAELSENIREQQESVQTDISKAKEEADFRKSLDNKVNNLTGDTETVN